MHTKASLNVAFGNRTQERNLNEKIAEGREQLPAEIRGVPLIFKDGHLRMYLTGETVRVAGGVGFTADWYWIVCMTLFRLMSPAMVAAAAVSGHILDARKLSVSSSGVL
jgi:hypothetical protein